MKLQRTQKLYHDESRLFYIVLSLFILCFSAYGYFVSASVVHVVMRSDVDRMIREEQSRISGLESAYIEAQHEVSADIAALNGFVHNPKKVFVDVSAGTLVLSRN